MAVAVAVAVGVAWAILAETMRLRAGWPGWWVLADIVPGLAFLGCGGWATLRRPGSRVGPLLVAAGFAWYVGTAATSTVPQVDRVLWAFQGYYDALLAWLVLSWPTGRLDWRASRLVVGGLFAVLVVRSVMRFTLFRWSGDLDVRDAGAVQQYVAAITLREQVDGVARLIIVLLAIAVIGLVFARWRAASTAGRRIVGPILVGGVAFAIAVIVEYVDIALSRSFAERALAWDAGHVLNAVAASAVPVAVLVGLRDERVARARVADLVDDLAGSPAGVGSSDLRGVLAGALGDPTLELVMPDPDGRLPPATPERAVTPLVRGGSPIGALVHDPALLDRPALLRSVTGAAALALENEGLRAEVAARLAEVQASRARIVAAGDEERRRIERDLHDGAQQRLVTLAISLRLARDRAAALDPDLAAAIDRARFDLEASLAELRELARGLHPSALGEDGLGAAIGGLAERSPIPVHTSVVDRRFPAAVESTVYFVIAEALTNVARHAAASEAWVSIAASGGQVTIEVRDDGVGGADGKRGSGLQGLADRVAAVGGELRIESTPGSGTTVRAVLPCA